VLNLRFSRASPLGSHFIEHISLTLTHSPCSGAVFSKIQEREARGGKGCQSQKTKTVT
jgi:hypothetical protein